MANYYVKSGAAGAANGSTWADAYTTLAAALAARAAGDTFWVSDAHAENAGAANIALASPGTAAAPCRILCVDDAAEPPTALATTATITNTTGSVAITFSGFAYCYGISFIQGSGGSSSTAMTFTNANPLWWKLEKCLLRLATTGATAQIAVGTANSGVDDAMVELVDSQIQFAAVGQFFQAKSKFRWTAPTGVQPLVVGTIPTTLFNPNTDAVGYAEIVGIDFSQLTSGKNLISLATTSSYDWTFRNCKLSTTGTLVTGSPSGIGGSRIKFVNCSSTDTNYELADYSYMGTITQETTIVRTSGATDGTTPISRKMVSTAGAKFEAPLVSDPIEYWNETLSALTVTIPVITDNVTLTDAEAWVEVEYLGTSGFPLADLIDDRMANIMSTPANQTTDGTSTWTTTGLGTPIKQSLAVTFTPAEKGIIRVRVFLAKASTTMYFDPLALTGQRQYQSTDSYVNEPAAAAGGATSYCFIG